MGHNLPLTLVYQPIVCSGAPRHVVWHEALARIQTTDGHLHSVWPMIEAGGEEAERAIDLKTPALLIRDMQRTPGTRPTLNVSAASLTCSKWRRVMQPLLETCSLRCRLTLEVTERSCLTAEAAPVLQSLQGKGICIALDDVTAPLLSDLETKEFAPDVVKLGKPVIDAFLRGEETQVREISSYAKRHGAALVAEGIETPASHFRIARAGIGYQQGYFHGRPSPLA